jgi:hypothetical protein
MSRDTSKSTAPGGDVDTPADRSDSNSAVPFDRPPVLSRNESVDTDPPRTAADAVERDVDGSLVDEGLIALVLATGLILFLLPEPVTSGIGLLLLLGGAAAWLAEWLF